ncbi:MAG: sigma-70 family RNA polymerase sigma factor [Flavobacteriaceae bacterium]|nr:sigma-70 family RNA polymerase sigma factor [Flavobacteriaceae bacterium]
MTNTDQDIIGAVLNGETSQFSILVDRYKDMIYTLAYRMLRNREEAEEAAQDTFIKTYSSLNKFKGDSKFSTWLYRVAYNCCLDRIKKNKRKYNTVSIDEFNYNSIKSLDDILNQIETQERNEAIKQCLNQLAHEDSYILTLYYYEELSLAEIAKTMSLTSNHVKVKLFRSRKRLASVLKDQIEPEIMIGYEKAFKQAIR